MIGILIKMILKSSNNNKSKMVCYCLTIKSYTKENIISILIVVTLLMNYQSFEKEAV